MALIVLLSIGKIRKRCRDEWKYTPAVREESRKVAILDQIACRVLGSGQIWLGSVSVVFGSEG